MQTLYTAVATNHGGRAGHADTEDGTLSVDLALPKAMGGGGKAGTNPEQLFALGYSSCFASAVQFVAGQQHKKVDDLTVTARVSIGPGEGGFDLAVELDVGLPSMSHDEAQKLVEAAHQVCPYSRATRGNVPVTLKVV